MSDDDDVHPPRVRRVAALLAAATLTAACGSTVQSRGALRANGPAGSGIADPANAARPDAAADTGLQPTVGDARSLGPQQAAGSTSVADGRGAATSPGGPTGGDGGSTTAARAATATEIKIGYVYSSDQEAVGSSLGLKGVVTGDTGRQYRAIAADINRSGGVLGRKIVLAGYDQSTANELNNPSDEENRACTFFREDQQVFAVLSSGTYLSPCLAKSGIPSIAAGSIEDPATINAQLKFSGGGMLINVLATAFIDRLAAQRYFTGWNTATGAPGPAPVKVGLIYQDIPVFRRYYAMLKQELRRQGITVDPSDEFIYQPTANGVASQSQAAVLRFSSDGVTHVFGAALFFYKAADNQQYHPRYAIDSLAVPALTAQNVGPSQLHGALGIGWRPTQDVDEAQDPGPVSPLATRCTKLMKDAGEDVSTRTVVYLSHIACEQMWSVAAALRKGGASTVPAMVAGFGSLGRVVPTLSFGERWAPDRRASNTTVADLRYDDACRCFTYTKARTSF